jgi:hypothetical protein
VRLSREASPCEENPIKTKLTADIVKALALPAGKTDHIEWDAELRGFGIRLRRDADSKVRKTGIVQWKRGGRSRRMNVGSVDLASPSELREIARGLLGRVANGEDPQAERHEAREKGSRSLRKHVTEFLAANARSWAPATLREVTRYLTDPKYFGPLHHKPLDAIGLKDVSACIVAIAVKHDATAGRARSALTNFFAWCMRMGLATANPCIGSINPKGRERDRVLTAADLVAIWRACGDDDYGRIVRLLVLTGCRRAETPSSGYSNAIRDCASTRCATVSSRAAMPGRNPRGGWPASPRHHLRRLRPSSRLAGPPRRRSPARSPSRRPPLRTACPARPEHQAMSGYAHHHASQLARSAAVPVFPCNPLNKRPLIPKEEGGNGYKDATTDDAVIKSWWTRWPDALIGVPTGPRFVVVDVDYVEPASWPPDDVAPLSARIDVGPDSAGAATDLRMWAE